MCKKYLQKFLGKVNYLRRFIANLSRKVDAFTPILRLKNDAEFTWGAKQQEAFDQIKNYLCTPPVMRAPKHKEPFRLYIAAEGGVIGAVLTQETEGKEHAITYLSRRLLDAETRYTFIEKVMSMLILCLHKIKTLSRTECLHSSLSNRCHQIYVA